MAPLDLPYRCPRCGRHKRFRSLYRRCARTWSTATRARRSTFSPRPTASAARRGSLPAGARARRPCWPCRAPGAGLREHVLSRARSRQSGSRPPRHTCCTTITTTRPSPTFPATWCGRLQRAWRSRASCHAAARPPPRSEIPLGLFARKSVASSACSACRPPGLARPLPRAASRLAVSLARRRGYEGPGPPQDPGWRSWRWTDGWKRERGGGAEDRRPGGRLQAELERRRRSALETRGRSARGWGREGGAGGAGAPSSRQVDVSVELLASLKQGWCTKNRS